MSDHVTVISVSPMLSACKSLGAGKSIKVFFYKIKNIFRSHTDYNHSETKRFLL